MTTLTAPAPQAQKQTSSDQPINLFQLGCLAWEQKHFGPGGSSWSHDGHAPPADHSAGPFQTYSSGCVA